MRRNKRPYKPCKFTSEMVIKYFNGLHTAENVRGFMEKYGLEYKDLRVWMQDLLDKESK